MGRTYHFLHRHIPSSTLVDIGAIMVRMLLGSLAAAVVMFFTGFVAWAAVDASITGVLQMPSGAQSKVIAAAAEITQPGRYMYPHPNDTEQVQQAAQDNGPIFTLHYRNTGTLGMLPTMGIGFVHFYFVGLALAALLVVTKPATFGARMRVVLYAGLFAALFIDISPIIWFHEPAHFHFYNFAYHLAACLLGGLPLAAIVKPPVAVAA